MLLLTLLLAMPVGCGGGQASKSPAVSVARSQALTGGTCWDDQELPGVLGKRVFATWVEKYAGGDATLGSSMRDDAAFSRKIPCTKPHALELYNVVELEPALLARVTTYAALLDQTSPLYRAIRDQVNEKCLTGSAYGEARRRAGTAVQLEPALSPTAGLHVAWDPFPADLWARGHHKFVCTFEQDGPGTLRLADLATARTPLAARVCLNSPGTYVPCSSRHQAEDMAEMILNTAIEKGQLPGRRAIRRGAKGDYVALSGAQYARLDKVCRTLFGAVSTVGGGVTARAYPGATSQWPTRAGVYLASCFAVKPGDPLSPMTGTVFDRG